MSRALRIRLAAGAITAAICWLEGHSNSRFLWLTYSVGFTHYALALCYSSRQLRAVAETPAQILSVTGLGLFSLFLYQVDFPLIAYFGLHHSLNEAYADSGSVRSSETSRLAAAAAVFQATAYLTALRASPELAGIDPRWTWSTAAIAALWFAAELYRFNRLHPGTAHADRYAPAIMATILIALSVLVRLTFIQVVLYHFILWALLPVERFRARGKAALGRYVLLSAAVTGLALLVSPLGPRSLRVALGSFSEQFLFWSYAHITMSFALSDAHPAWIVRLFREFPGQRLVPRVGLSSGIR